MKSFLAALGTVSLLSFAAAPAPAQPPDLRPPIATSQRCDPAADIGVITFCNPLGRSRGPGAGGGLL